VMQRVAEAYGLSLERVQAICQKLKRRHRNHSRR
jgi:hypothetical protein